MGKELFEGNNIEVWGGVECTLNRVGDIYRSQCSRSGHLNRLSDLDLIAELGIKKLRYPILWEHLATENEDDICWEWTDERLNRLRQLGIEPIVTLVHHGCGPHYATFDTDRFAPGLASFAAKVAARYPWLKYFTPVNEPLTTARFSGLYGRWYPHQQSSQSFARLLLNQCQGIQMAMTAIRQVIPEAQLIQTEDLGYTHSTPKLRYQARYENHRRWLTFDLLAGRVNATHPLWPDLIAFGIAHRELEEMIRNACPPDILGINHYVTSERYLDQRTRRYPAHTHGRNAWHQYADVEAVRIKQANPLGPEKLLHQAWKRYKIPLAVTEVHMACHRIEQLRWHRDLWNACHIMQRKGVAIRGVTSWSLFGAYDWNTLVTQDQGHYECGAFDLRSPAPRPTAIARMVQSLASEASYEHPALEGAGWWQRHKVQVFLRSKNKTWIPPTPVVPPVLITGASGTLGRAFAKACEEHGLAYRLSNRVEMDIADAISVQAAIERYRPWVIINTAGYVRVDQAETDTESCTRDNTTGPSVLAAACAASGIKLATFSSDLVFDGQASEPYTESSTANPLNEYGRSKARAETQVLERCPEALVIRTSAFFGPVDEHNFVFHALRTLAKGEPFSAASDAFISPTYVPDLANTVLDLLIDDEKGIWHLANKGCVSWAELARKAAALAGLSTELVEEVPTAGLGLPAPRPLYTVLTSEKADLMPTLDESLKKAVKAIMHRLKVAAKANALVQ